MIYYLVMTLNMVNPNLQELWSTPASQTEWHPDNHHRLALVLKAQTGEEEPRRQIRVLDILKGNVSKFWEKQVLIVHFIQGVIIIPLIGKTGVFILTQLLKILSKKFELEYDRGAPYKPQQNAYCVGSTWRQGPFEYWLCWLIPI